MKARSLLPIVLAVLAGHASAQTPPRCDDPRVQELVKEAFVRRVVVNGDEALIQRGALHPREAFSEQELVQGMPRMIALAHLEGVAERSFTGQQRRCVARMAVQGWKELQPTATYLIANVSDAAGFGVDANVQLPVGAEGFNLMVAYRSTFGGAIRR